MEDYNYPEYILFAKQFGYHIVLNDEEDKIQIFLKTSEISPILIRIDIDKESDRITVWGFIRTSSWVFDGDRSDLHDVLTSVLAMVLRNIEGVSVSLHTYPHLIGDVSAEFYAKVFSFERYNLVDCVPNKENLKLIERILTGIMVAMLIIDSIFLLKRQPHIKLFLHLEKKNL